MVGAAPRLHPQHVGAGACDLVIGVPAGYELAETTDAYYRSAYVYVYRADRGPELHSMRDPRLRHLRIGVHLIGDDGVNPPPAHALGEQGIVDNVVGYMIYGDYREPNPPVRIVEAVATGELDVAAVWGPIGRYFAKHASVPLKAVPITDTAGFAPLRFEFGIAMGVRKGEHAFRDELNRILKRRREDIHRLLDAYGVPQVRDAASRSGGRSGSGVAGRALGATVSVHPLPASAPRWRIGAITALNDTFPQQERDLPRRAALRGVMGRQRRGCFAASMLSRPRNRMGANTAIRRYRAAHIMVSTSAGGVLGSIVRANDLAEISDRGPRFPTGGRRTRHRQGPCATLGRTPRVRGGHGSMTAAGVTALLGSCCGAAVAGSWKGSASESKIAVRPSIALTKSSRASAPPRSAMVPPVGSWWISNTSSSVCASPLWK